MKTRLLLTILAPAAVGFGCGETPSTTATFTSLKPTIKTCASFDSCHSAKSTLGGGLRLDLATDPYAALVGAPTQAPVVAKLKADFPTLVVAGDAAKSACYVKMTLASAKDTNYGDRMPQASLPLDAVMLANFKSWINAGAKND